MNLNGFGYDVEIKFATDPTIINLAVLEPEDIKYILGNDNYIMEIKDDKIKVLVLE